MEHSPFATLSRELRDEIYRHVLSIGGALQIRTSLPHEPPASGIFVKRWKILLNNGHRRSFPLPDHTLALMGTCG